jgi:hypothetical protein
MVRIFGWVAPRVARTSAIAVLGALLTSSSVFAQAPDPNRFFFPGGAGLILNFIKPDKAADWEAMIEKITTAMKASENPQRKAQAGAWKVYKSAEQPVKDAILYFWLLEGAPADGEYSMVKILTELFPKEANAMYQEYSAAYQPPAQQFFHLTLSKDFTK